MPGGRVPPPAFPLWTRQRSPLSTRQSGGGLLGLPRRGGALGDRDLDVERRPAGLAARAVRIPLDPDAAVQPADELPADVEAEAGAADAAGHVRIEAVELLEDATALRRRDAEAAVRHRPEDAALAARDLHLDGPALGRVLDRVLHEVHEHLAQLLLVGGHR